MVLHHIPSWIPYLLKDITWHKDRDAPKIYLTFDDGPVPGVTDFILELLALRSMTATFFVVGDNVVKHATLAQELLANGHSIGNHTFHHLKGTQTKDWTYLKDVLRCQHAIQDTLGCSPRLFRPPYGVMNKGQLDALKNTYEIVLWDVLSGDYDPQQAASTCLQKSMQYTQAGSIVLFHDQEKTRDKIRKVLPDYLSWVTDQGFQTASL
ncbi:polysaccharide deacetylase family protein [Mongoliitalea daihaiensis]|uniref:polysaccharide deacetylase family protein n=1 Tax=Mongoliitalea daihaiensis TaxID=2782006 RepID=UPI001F27CF87|nr:polysaccharide deacetylase family protein [Mongoliitalea daihaiensis]UJP65178.1 polysaccharide deacetylase family protein [Mongoliitalea daihaiensis]